MDVCSGVCIHTGTKRLRFPTDGNGRQPAAEWARLSPVGQAGGGLYLTISGRLPGCRPRVGRGYATAGLATVLRVPGDPGLRYGAGLRCDIWWLVPGVPAGALLSAWLALPLVGVCRRYVRLRSAGGSVFWRLAWACWPPVCRMRTPRAAAETRDEPFGGAGKRGPTAGRFACPMPL